MAPNAEENFLVTMSRGPNSKERLRPPTYNAEDYAIALRRWGRRALVGQPDSSGHGTLPSTCTSTSSGYASTNPGEMTLRQFTSVSELLNKLRADLQLAFPSFVQEFASTPSEGISLLLETLRGVQLSQSTPPSATGSGQRPRARRAALDELGCVECLAACTERCHDAVRILANAQPGLLALTVCLTSSLNRTRVLALQLLTRVCQTSGGHAAVSEAVSTLRLRYGEGGRFRFLAGALLAPKAAPALRLAGVSFLNAFIASAPRAQTKLYIQAEACEAGLEPRALQEWLRTLNDETEMSGEAEQLLRQHQQHQLQQPSLSELLRKEVHKWSRHCIDIDALQVRARRAEESCRSLSKKVAALQKQLQKLQLERLNEYNVRTFGKICVTGKDDIDNDNDNNNDNDNDITNDGGDARKDKAMRKSQAETEKKLSSSAEDEGISFSERSSSPECAEEQSNDRQNVLHHHSLIDNDQETTIDDVIEELRIIVKDAEEELHDWKHLKEETTSTSRTEFHRQLENSKTKNSQPSKARECLRSSEESARIDRKLASNDSLKIVVPAPATTQHQQLHRQKSKEITRMEEEEYDKESAIVPAIIHPQPPRRAPPACLMGRSTSLFLMSHAAAHPTSYDITTVPLDQEEIEERTIEGCVNSEHDYDDDDDDELDNDDKDNEELLLLEVADGASDSLLGISRLHCYSEAERSSVLRQSVEASAKELLLHSGRWKSLSSSAEFTRFESLADFEISETVFDERCCIAKRSSSTGRLEHQQQLHQHSSNSLESRQAYSRCSNTLQRRTERRKYLRRCQSQEHIELRQQAQHDRRVSPPPRESSSGSLKSRGSGRAVLERIQKFESLNGFEAQPDSTARLRRSESFHQTSFLPAYEEQTRRQEPRQNSISKSLDRIDEGLDSMLDLVGKRATSRQFYRKLSSDEEPPPELPARGVTSKDGAKFHRKERGRREDKANQETQRHRSTTGGKEHKYTSFLETNSHKEAGSSFNNADDGNNGQPRIFANRAHDVLSGFGKKRFNAGKYSGNAHLLAQRSQRSSKQQQQQQPFAIKKNPAHKHLPSPSSFQAATRAKVTDVLSGLY